MARLVPIHGNILLWMMSILVCTTAITDLGKEDEVSQLTLREQVGKDGIEAEASEKTLRFLNAPPLPGAAVVLLQSSHRDVMTLLLVSLLAFVVCRIVMLRQAGPTKKSPDPLDYVFKAQQLQQRRAPPQEAPGFTKRLQIVIGW
mmetsp:Transcript_19550/g.34509  ORF Transcript_19550/g.34509 Transcript_19550/m.34509 type:complete len:145 (-) Transcript_19550:282-716(-)|eukprot:CAMPEP_0197654324 /NCGR_PEP_ID=MMETSP1338-20131121/38785_1 /TAXON_ID=43686 ORGANISM="Pelagodinium beii, Strain RCC1491" /NCGR_SAMPLE_ID=MMETSP1338 /ASSEMBLY_ACC=CAM_ASM_000754 /LENGTH=144 /DNA_ID=CAMNT_0043229755 /DNA_START=49 /DNA_END=483 /DNA_ORIENTATION=+